MTDIDPNSPEQPKKIKPPLLRRPPYQAGQLEQPKRPDPDLDPDLDPDPIEAKPDPEPKLIDPALNDLIANGLNGGTEPGWGELDLSGSNIRLPDPGPYDGCIADVKISESPYLVWMIVEFKLDGHEAAPAAWVEMVASKDKVADQHKLADGARAINKLIDATRMPVDAIKTVHDLYGFVGKKVNLTIGIKRRDGVPEMVVRAVKPRA